MRCWTGLWVGVMIWGLLGAPTFLAEKAHVHLQVKPGGDAAP